MLESIAADGMVEFAAGELKLMATGRKAVIHIIRAYRLFQRPAPQKQIPRILERANMLKLGHVFCLVSGLPAAMPVRASPGFPGSLALTPRSGV